eukprot:3723102-Alexandrium_andersonii.AAC.2
MRASTSRSFRTSPCPMCEAVQRAPNLRAVSLQRLGHGSAREHVRSRGLCAPTLRTTPSRTSPTSGQVQLQCPLGSGVKLSSEALRVGPRLWQG